MVKGPGFACRDVYVLPEEERVTRGERGEKSESGLMWHEILAAEHGCTTTRLLRVML